MLLLKYQSIQHEALSSRIPKLLIIKLPMASSDYPSQGYIFTRDSKSTLRCDPHTLRQFVSALLTSVVLYQRLNHQHWLITQLCGYLLHHRIPAALVQSSHFRIADIGTGTWYLLSHYAPFVHVGMHKMIAYLRK